MLARSILFAITAAAAALAAPVPAPDAAPAPAPALNARKPAQSWWVTNDGIVDTDGDGVPEYYPSAIVWSTVPPSK